MNKDNEKIFIFNKRFVIDNKLSINKDIAETKIFYSRFDAYCKLFPELKVSYDKYISYIEDNFKFDREAFFEERNSIIGKLVSRLEENALKYDLSTNKYESILKEKTISFPLEFTDKSFYNETRLNQTFLSFDLKSANFSALKFFDKRIIDEKDTYEDFVRQFTDNEFLINSKHLRTSSLGKVCAKQQVRIEKEIVRKIFAYLKTELQINEVIVNKDEIICENIEDNASVLKVVKDCEEMLGVKISTERFKLSLISPSNGFIKTSVDLKTSLLKTEFKDVSTLISPFVINKLIGEDNKCEDFYFINQIGVLSKMIEAPKLEIL